MFPAKPTSKNADHSVAAAEAADSVADEAEAAVVTAADAAVAEATAADEIDVVAAADSETAGIKPPKLIFFFFVFVAFLLSALKLHLFQSSLFCTDVQHSAQKS